MGKVIAIETRMIVVVFAGLLVSDSLVIDFLRRLLLSFFRSKRNHKRVNREYRNRPLKDRITLDYIVPPVEAHLPIFKRFRFIYRAELISLVPQYAALLILLICGKELILIWAGMILSVIKIIFIGYLRCLFNANMISKFEKRYKK